MARVQYGGGVTDFRGSIAGTTFQSTRAGGVARHRTGPKRGITPSQQLSLRVQHNATRAWRSLTDAQRNAWNALADGYQRTDKFGQVSLVSGCQLFTSCWSNASYLGLTQLTDPVSLVPPTPIDIAALTLVGDVLYFGVTFLSPPVDTGVIVHTSPPLAARTAIMRPALRLTDSYQVPPSDDVDITQAWLETHHLPTPNLPTFAGNLQVLAYPVNTTTMINGAGVFSAQTWSHA